MGVFFQSQNSKILNSRGKLKILSTDTLNAADLINESMMNYLLTYNITKTNISTFTQFSSRLTGTDISILRGPECH